MTDYPQRDWKKATESIVEYGPGDIAWGFDGTAFIRPRRGMDYATQIRLDPTPAYGHDPLLAWDVLQRVRASFPMPDPHAPQVHVFPREMIERTNAVLATVYLYSGGRDEDDAYAASSEIILSAKRIPPHPAMTTYLVAHEYGHAVEPYIASTQLGFKDPHGRDHDAVLKMYRELRGMPAEQPLHASPGTWHASVAEVFACDFRVLIAQEEATFWPHAGVPDPRSIRPVIDWWIARRREALDAWWKVSPLGHPVVEG